MEKIYDDPDAGAVTIRKNVRSRRVTLRVNPRRGVTVTVPYFVPYKAGLEFFLAKKRLGPESPGTAARADRSRAYSYS